MVRTRGNVANNAPPEGVATTQKLDEILAALLDTRDHLVVLEQHVMGNEEDEEAAEDEVAIEDEEEENIDEVDEENDVEESEVDQLIEEAEEDVEEAELSEDEVETEKSDSDEDEEENKEKAEIVEDEEELIEIEIDGVTYCTENDDNGFIYELDNDGNVGETVGYLKNGEPFFN